MKQIFQNLKTGTITQPELPVPHVGAGSLLIQSHKSLISLGTEKMFGAKIELDYKDGYPPTVNHKKCTENVIKAISRIIGGKSHAPYLSMGGEDFSYFAEKVPGCFFFLGTAPKNSIPMSVPQHCSHFDIDEEAMLIGSSIFVQLALNN